MTMMADLTGRRVGKLQVMWPAGLAGKRRNIFWMTQCDCGEFKAVSAALLASESVKSCGCLRYIRGRKKPRTRQPDKRSLHGQGTRGRRTPEYIAFVNAKGRCRNSADPRYGTYGARGIEFRFTSFDEFFTELGPRPQGKVIDRINNDGHYEKGNIRWATRKEQSNNTRRNKGKVRLTYVR